MKKVVSIFLLAASFSVLSGCSFVLGLLPTAQVTVEFVNNTDFPVTVQAFYNEDDDALEVVLEEFGTEVNQEIPAGETRSFSQNCADLGAIYIERAELNVIGSIGPEAGTDVQRQEQDFECGETLRFTFSGTVLDLNISVSSSATATN